jgi:hypothetical protein
MALGAEGPALRMLGCRTFGRAGLFMAQRNRTVEGWAKSKANAVAFTLSKTLILQPSESAVTWVRRQNFLTSMSYFWRA